MVELLQSHTCNGSEMVACVLQSRDVQWYTSKAIGSFPALDHIPLLLITSPYIAHCLGACIIARGLFSVALYPSAPVGDQPQAPEVFWLC